ncbi:MAG: hypothetical protein IKF64_03655 [Eubacterium sp.]|nr:hypothetical protein [Eubacterium sp.]
MFRDCTSLTTPSELWATDLTEGCYYGMFQGCTGIKLSTEQTAEYSAPYSIPKEETAESVGYDALTNMFTGTGGTFTGTPTINTTYYIPGSTPVYTDGFMVGDDHYDTLDEAIAGSASGDTITALSDVDFTIYLAFTRHTFDLSGRTLDLDGHTITGYNHSVVYVGDNFTIKNGNMTCVYDSVNNKKESYAAVIYPQVGNWQTDVVTDKSTGVVLENLVLTGGINCFGSDVTVRGENTNVTGNYYYALWADVLSTLTVEDGTFTSAASSTNGIIGACSDAGKEAYVDISGGDYTVPAGKNLVLQSTMASSQQLVEISGGTYNVVVPAKACAEGFVPVTTPNAQGKYTVDNIDNYEAKVDGKYYATFEEAVAAARTGSAKTVTVVNDVDLTSYPAKGMHRIDITNVTIDLNQHTFTASGRWGVLFEGTNATIKNGTMEAIDNSDATGYQYGVYVWGRDGSDEMPDPAQKASVTLENLTVNYGIHTYNAEVTVKDCDVTGSSKYYAIWADCESTVNVESGNFTTGGAAVLGTAQYQNTLFGHINVEGGNFTVPAGKKLIQTGSSCKTSNTQFEGGTALYTNGSVYTINAENLAPHYVQNMTTGEVYQGEANNETSIEVADTINEKFYLDKDFYEEAYGANVYVGINYNHNSDVNQAPDFDTDVKAMSSLPVEDDKATFDVTQAPAQVTEDVTINIYASQADAQAGINAVDTVTTSTYKYCRTIITTSNDAELVALAESALDYAAAAQTFFNYNTANMATKDAQGGFYGNVEGADLSGVEGFTALPSCVRNATMVIKSNLAINLLANTAIDVTDASIDATNSNFAYAPVYQNGDFFVIHTEGIEPANMDAEITIETSAGEIVFTANTIMRVMANSSDANKATLAKAGYLYGVAANNYFE